LALKEKLLPLPWGGFQKQSNVPRKHGRNLAAGQMGILSE